MSRVPEFRRDSTRGQLGELISKVIKATDGINRLSAKQWINQKGAEEVIAKILTRHPAYIETLLNTSKINPYEVAQFKAVVLLQSVNDLLNVFREDHFEQDFSTNKVWDALLSYAENSDVPSIENGTSWSFGEINLDFLQYSIGYWEIINAYKIPTNFHEPLLEKFKPKVGPTYFTKSLVQETIRETRKMTLGQHSAYCQDRNRRMITIEELYDLILDVICRGSLMNISASEAIKNFFGKNNIGIICRNKFKEISRTTSGTRDYMNIVFEILNLDGKISNVHCSAGFCYPTLYVPTTADITFGAHFDD